MAVASTDNAIRSSSVTRVFVYLFLLLFALFYLLPLYIMLINSLKPLDEITGGGMVPCLGTGRSSPG
jgi:glucose/mannose transport system permease protein